MAWDIHQQQLMHQRRAACCKPQPCCQPPRLHLLAEVPEQRCVVLLVQRAHPAVPVREVQREVLRGVPATAAVETAVYGCKPQLLVIM
jgi:hypothetical protein